MAARQLSDGRVCTPSCGAAFPRAPLSADVAAAHGSAEPKSLLGYAPPPPREGAREPWLDLHRTMATAREIERVELELVRRGLAFFHVSGAGHEATACLARHLTPDDWLHVHYRDKALLLARGLPIEEFFASLLCRAGSHSEGRQMSAHYSDPRLNVLSQTGPVGNHALQAVGVAAALEDGLPSPSSQKGDGLGRPSSHDAGDAIVLCTTGDGSTQQGQFLEAVAEAVRSRLPVLFVIEDNHLAISTRTAGRTFWDLPCPISVAELVRVPAGGPTSHEVGYRQGTGQTSHKVCYSQAEEFYGLPIVHVDGSDVPAVDHVFEEIVSRMRHDRLPALVVLDVERLADHSNADDQDQYRDPREVAEALATADPLRRLEEFLIECGVSPDELLQTRRQVAAEVEAAAERALRLPDPQPSSDAKAPLPSDFSTRPEYTGTCGTAVPGCAAVAKGDSGGAWQTEDGLPGPSNRAPRNSSKHYARLAGSAFRAAESASGAPTPVSERCCRRRPCALVSIVFGNVPNRCPYGQSGTHGRQAEKREQTSFLRRRRAHFDCLRRQSAGRGLFDGGDFYETITFDGLVIVLHFRLGVRRKRGPKDKKR